MTSVDAFTYLSCSWPHYTGWLDTPCCWRISGKGVQTLRRKSWSTPSRKRWKSQSVSPWNEEPRAPVSALVKELGGPGAPGNQLGFQARRWFHWAEVTGSGNVDLTLSLQCKSNTLTTMGSMHILATLWELLTLKGSRSLHDFQMWVQAGKLLLPRWWRHLVFNIHTEPTHKANGSKQHEKPFWRINYHRHFFFRSLKSRANLNITPTAIFRTEIRG